MKTSTGKPTKAEQERFETLLDIGCLACLSFGFFSVPQIHHLLSGGKRRGHMFTVPLCPYHHQNYPPTKGLKWALENLGPSLAGNPKAFRHKFGDDEALLKEANDLIEKLTGKAA
jgi:hypothetical protein